MGSALTSARGGGGRPLIGISTSEEHAPSARVPVSHGEPPGVEIVLGRTKPRHVTVCVTFSRLAIGCGTAIRA